MANVSFSQRKAYGRQYAIDPAYAFASEEMANRYALAPGREAAAESNRRFDTSQRLEENRLKAQEDQFERGQKQAAISGITSTAANLVGMDLMFNKGAASKGVYSYAKGIFGGTPAASGVVKTSTIPALDTGAPWLAPSEGNMAAVGASETAAPSALSMAGPVAITAAASYGGSKVGQWAGKQMGVGGNKERGIIGGATAGAAVGTILPGLGTIIGAVIGATVGAIDTSWICTAIDEKSHIINDDKAELAKLRMYAINEHNQEFSAYVNNGPTLIHAINKSGLGLVVFDFLNKTLIRYCIERIRKGKFEEAYQYYKKITLGLCRQYSVDLKVS